MLALATAALAALAVAPVAAQAPYPDHAVRILVPFPPGGPADALARIAADEMARSFGQPVVVENRPGAGGNIGMELGAKAPPDGYTLTLAPTGNLTVAPHLYAKLPYDPAKDYAPITVIAAVPNILIVNPRVPARSLAELIALAKAKPGVVKYSTPGNASSNHVAGALLESMAGIKLTHVPYKGSGPATIAALGGEVDIVITGIATVTPQWKAGKLKILAIGADKRHPSWPDIPSTGEAGLQGYYAGTWFGVVARTGTPRGIIDKLNREIVAALSAGELKDRLTAIGFDVFTGTPEEFAAFMKTDMARAAKVIKAAGIKASE